MTGCRRVRSGIVATVAAVFMLGLLAGIPSTADARPEQGQLRISLIIPERATVVVPALELNSRGAPRLCNTHPASALREIRHLEGEQQLGRCSPGADLTEASGRHLVLVSPI